MATGPLHTSVCGRPDASLSASWIAPGDMTLPFASIKPRLTTKSVGSGVLERDVEPHRGGTGTHARPDGDAQPSTALPQLSRVVPVTGLDATEPATTCTRRRPGSPMSACDLVETIARSAVRADRRGPQRQGARRSAAADPSLDEPLVDRDRAAVGGDETAVQHPVVGAGDPAVAEHRAVAQRDVQRVLAVR
jgi:hypothetical protein